ncbi:hypothetical protein EUX98_g5822 [Antrodiella citrinella]|uniref:BTB domain-containing protein n=1 Tax=Antrodiella citrinella TaxID=2447956 RepID=A0A4S4MQN6_9APHY|nr:hypothetical protein EUX98_g5822 [Antrodiella citrinella]
MPETYSSPCPSAKLFDAAVPFNRIDADLILRSNDSVDFRVHRAILEMSSSFFAEGLDALDKRNIGMTLPEDGCLPICYFYADSHTINLVLRHVYPFPTPDVQDIGNAFDVLQVAREYDFRLVTTAMKKTVLRLAEESPLKVYARASLRRCEGEMRVAARLSLRYPILDAYTPELEKLSAGTYHRLLSYHRLCGRVAAAVIDDLRWATILYDAGCDTPSWSSCQLCPKFALGSVRGSDVELRATSWFHTLLLTIKQALRARPCGSTVYASELSEPSLGEAMTCLVCRATALPDWKRFVALLRDEVNHVISEVSYIPFELPALSADQSVSSSQVQLEIP